ncbi:MAG TPA: Wzz/FepE/Etk N-terminal domain-containing protein [Candidatus Sulfotelmatobacter sp.]|nr:Wzz/FepE/Etk N-terminal domain-containing protein [Candidatus Sulfotelmatobacter sp.]
MALPELVQWQARRLTRDRPAFLPMPEPAVASTDFVETLRKLMRQRWLIAVCGAAAAITAIVFVLAIPPSYQAEARVLVGVPEPRALDVASIVRDSGPDSERVQSEIYAVESRDLIAEVIDRLHLADNPEFNPTLPHEPGWARLLVRAKALLPSLAPRSNAGEPAVAGTTSTTDPGTAPPTGEPSVAPQEDAAHDAARSPLENRMVDILLSKLSVSALGRSNVISIQAEAQQPEEAAAIANAVAARYLAHQKSEKIQTAQEVERFLSDRIAELRQQVQKSEQAVEDYRRANGLFKGESANVTSQQMTELNTQMILAQTAKAEADARYNEAVAMHKAGAEGDSVPDVLKSPLIAALKEQQAQTESKLSDLAGTYGPEHPKIISMRAEASDINKKIRTEISRITEGLKHEASTADARYEALRENFAKLQTQMGLVNDKSIHLEALERDATVNRNLLASMLGREKEIVGQKEIEQADAKLISSAAPPSFPAFPPKTLIVFLGTLGGSLIGLLAGLVREGADRTFRLGDQIEEITGLPVLAMVPRVSGSKSPALEVLQHPVSPFSEALRKLDIGIQMSDLARAPRSVLFSSATPGEGKSVLAAAFGRLAASHGRRVLLIDCDWRSPSLHKLFRLPNRGGLAALLDSDTVVLEEVIKRDEASGADIITAGDLDPRSAHRLMSRRMQMLLDTFAKNYDLVVLDSPPVLVGADVLSICRMVDKVVYAIRWGKTRREVAFDGLKQIIEARGQVAGVVLSRVDSKRYPHYGYGNLDYEYPRPASSRLLS